MIPETLGRYQIQEQLGRGGMATVYRAHDPRFNRDVAVKILPRELTLDPQFRTRFDREAQTIAALEHPAIVPVYDYGEQEGQPYLVMRLMRGGSLADRLVAGPLPHQDVSKILDRIGSALDRAHLAGVIHRDLKPGNILFDEFGEAYLADFGIARLADSSATLTGSGLVGTPAYMSPEQIEGKALDGRTDIYALGIIVFEMLTGERPYQADTPAMLLVKQMTEPMPRVLDVKPDLPPGCEEVITRATAKQATSRYEKASQLAKTLSSALRYEWQPSAELPPTQPRERVTAVSQSPPTRVAEPKPVVPKRPLPRWLWVVIGSLVLAGLAAMVVSQLRQPDKNTEAPLAQTAVANAITPENAADLVKQTQIGRGVIETAVLSPDSQSIAVGTSAGLWIYDAHTLELKQQLLGHTALVSVVAWSPDSKQLASGSWDQTVRLWNIDTGEQTGEIQHPDQLIALAWSPTDNVLASATWGSLILLWDTSTTHSLGELAGHSESVTQLAFSPDGTLLASASPDSVRLWQVAQQQETAVLNNSPNDWSQLHWSPAGNELLATSLPESNVQVWGVDGRSQLVLDGMEYGVFAAAWSPDGSQIITSSGDGLVRLWDSVTGQSLRQLSTNDSDTVPVHIIWQPDSQDLFYVNENGTMAVVNPDSREVKARSLAHTAVTGAIAFSPDGTQLATGHSDGSVRIWQANTEEPFLIFEGHTYGVSAIAWSPDGTSLVSAGGDGTVRVWDIAQKRESLQWAHPNDAVSTVAWAPESPLVALADYAGHLWLWNTETDRIEADWQVHEGNVSRVAWSPDGSELASSGWDGLVHIWDPQTEAALLTFTGHTDAVRDVAWSPDGTRLASVSHDFSVQVWDRADGNVRWQETHDELVASVAWSADGRLLATGSWDLTIIVWDAETGAFLTQLTDHIGPIIALDWSDTGAALASASEDSTAILWRLP